MACGNPDGTQFGVDACYCSSPGTAADEAAQAQRYAIVDAERLRSNESPFVAFCLNARDLEPIEVQYGANCQVDFPLDDGELIQVGPCPCVFLEPLVEDRWHIPVGVNSSAAGLGLTLDNLDIVSSQAFQY